MKICGNFQKSENFIVIVNKVSTSLVKFVKKMNEYSTKRKIIGKEKNLIGKGNAK